MPSRLARASSSRSSASSVESGFGEPSSRNSAFLDRIAAFSNVPPTPTPRINGGHASGPAVFTHSTTNSFTPGSPAAGVSIVYFEVLAAAALGHEHDLQRGARDDVDVDHRRCVGPGGQAIERR